MHAPADPITTEIIRNAFISCAQDMNATLIRSSYTPIIYEGKDCSVAILDENGDVLGQSLGLPLFLGNLEICVKLAAEQYGWDVLQARRRLLHERLVHDRHAPERRHHLRPDLLARPAGRLLRDARALARRRRRRTPAGRWTRTRSTRRACAGGRPGSTTRGEPREDMIDLLRRNRRFGYSLDRRHERPGRRLPNRRDALPGDPRPLRLRHLHRGARRDLPPVGAARARAVGSDPRRRVHGGGLPRRRRARDTGRCRCTLAIDGRRAIG